MEHQETAVTIEKDIEELNRFNKFEQFITLSTCYHVNQCKLGINCKKCDLMLNLRHVENFVNGYITIVEKLQNYCRLNYVNFYSLRVMLHSLVAVERLILVQGSSLPVFFRCSFPYQLQRLVLLLL